MATLAFSSGEEPPASKLDDLVSVWLTATPAWTTSGTQPAIGNGTRITRYKQVGRICHFRIGFKFGSTTTFGTGQYSFGLPVTPKDPGSPFDSWEHIGMFKGLDASASNHIFGQALRNTGSSVILWNNARSTITPVAEGIQTLNATNPFTWATTDYLNIWGSYETAD